MSLYHVGSQRNLEVSSIQAHPYVHGFLANFTDKTWFSSFEARTINRENENLGLLLFSMSTGLFSFCHSKTLNRRNCCAIIDSWIEVFVFMTDVPVFALGLTLQEQLADTNSMRITPPATIRQTTGPWPNMILMSFYFRLRRKYIISMACVRVLMIWIQNHLSLLDADTLIRNTFFPQPTSSLQQFHNVSEATKRGAMN